MIKINFEQNAWQKINAYIKEADGEISGLGRAIFDKATQSFMVSDVYIWKQECDSASTEVVDHDSVFNLAIELEKKGIPIEELCVWWHSHADMGAFFSTTDDDTIKEWQNNKYLVSVVGNKAGQFKARVDLKNSIVCTIDAEVSHYSAITKAITEQAKKDIKKMVVKSTIQNYGWKNGKEYNWDEHWENVRKSNHKSQYDSDYYEQDDLDYNQDDLDLGYPKEPDEETFSLSEIAEIYVDSAQHCGCQSCKAFLKKDSTSTFKPKKHFWNNLAGLYSTKPPLSRGKLIKV